MENTVSRKKKRIVVRQKKKVGTEAEGKEDENYWERYYEYQRKKLGIEKYDFERPFVGSALNERPDLQAKLNYYFRTYSSTAARRWKISERNHTRRTNSQRQYTRLSRSQVCQADGEQGF